MNFVVFHGAWTKDHVEGPYDPNAGIGIDTFLRALDDHRVPPDSNLSAVRLWAPGRLPSANSWADRASKNTAVRSTPKIRKIPSSSIWVGPPNARQTGIPSC